MRTVTAWWQWAVDMSPQNSEVGVRMDFAAPTSTPYPESAVTSGVSESKVLFSFFAASGCFSELSGVPRHISGTLRGDERRSTRSSAPGAPPDDSLAPRRVYSRRLPRHQSRASGPQDNAALRAAGKLGVSTMNSRALGRPVTPTCASPERGRGEWLS
jgi:hypothetical protein